MISAISASASRATCTWRRPRKARSTSSTRITRAIFTTIRRRSTPPRRSRRSEYEERASPTGALFVGSPQQIIDKILYEHELFGHQRFLAQLDIGGQPFAKVAAGIELLASEVAPIVRRETA